MLFGNASFAYTLVQPIGNPPGCIAPLAEFTAKSNHFRIDIQVHLASGIRVGLRIKPKLHVIHQIGQWIGMERKMAFLLDDPGTDAADC
ncbi:hypothetical protein D3C85_1532470 [compost metagenome]